MNFIDLFTLGVVGLLILGGLTLIRRGGVEEKEAGRRSHRREMALMPDEIATGRLVMSEQNLKVDLAGMRVYGRSEQVYQTAADELVVVESKTRQASRVYLSDVIQASLQAVALAAGGKRVASQGYVRTSRVDSGAVTYHPIRLMSRRVLEDLVVRYFDVIEGRREPRIPENRAACRNCGFRTKCWPQG